MQDAQGADQAKYKKGDKKCEPQAVSAADAGGAAAGAVGAATGMSTPAIVGISAGTAALLPVSA